MSQSAIDTEIAPEAFAAPLPRPRAPQTRRVGTIRLLSATRSLGLVIDEADSTDAIFSIDHVVPEDRHLLAAGLQVSYLVVDGRDGTEARDVRVDTTTLPPLPPETMQQRGWR